jgi:hypothetical protein
MKSISRSIDAEWDEDEVIDISDGMPVDTIFDCRVNGKFRRYLFNDKQTFHHFDYGVKNGLVIGSTRGVWRNDLVKLFFQDGKLHNDTGPAIIALCSRYVTLKFFKRGKPWLVFSEDDGWDRHNCVCSHWDNLEYYRNLTLGGLFSCFEDCLLLRPET